MDEWKKEIHFFPLHCHSLEDNEKEKLIYIHMNSFIFLLSLSHQLIFNDEYSSRERELFGFEISFHRYQCLENKPIFSRLGKSVFIDWYFELITSQHIFYCFARWNLVMWPWLRMSIRDSLLLLRIDLSFDLWTIDWICPIGLVIVVDTFLFSSFVIESIHYSIVVQDNAGSCKR